MNFQRFEGMGPAVGIVLIVMIIAVLGIRGPLDWDEAHKWQTLIAGGLTGCLAIVAACIAYCGSSAQARLNKKIHREELSRRRLSLFLKLEFACEQLIERARNVEGLVTFPPIDDHLRYEKRDLEILAPPEIEECWAYLDIFPRESIAEIRIIRNGLKLLAHLLDPRSDEEWPTLWPVDCPRSYLLTQVSEIASETWKAAAVVSDALRPLIVEMAPEFDQQKKLRVVYGDPELDPD